MSSGSVLLVGVCVRKQVERHYDMVHKQEPSRERQLANTVSYISACSCSRPINGFTCFFPVMVIEGSFFTFFGFFTVSFPLAFFAPRTVIFNF